MNNNFRNTDLLQKLERHPLKAQLAKALNIAEAFQGDVEFLQLNRDLSPEGRQKALQSKLRAAVRDLRDARAPINEMQKKLDAKRKAVAMPAFDPNDVVGFLRRQEIRTVLRGMDEGSRAVLLASNPEFIDSMLEQPALSGAVPNQIIEAAKKERLAGLFGPQLLEIEEMEKVVAEANMITDLARVDLQLHSGMEPRVFAEFAKPVEAKQNAHWLKRYTEEGREVIRVIDLENHGARIATEREILDGKFYKDHAEYLADRAALQRRRIMAKKHGGTHHVQGVLHRGTKPQPSPIHHGSGKPLGVVHEAPTRPAVNAGGTFGMGTLKKRK